MTVGQVMPITRIANSTLKLVLGMRSSWHGAILMSRVICPTAMMITWRFTLDAAESPLEDIALTTATSPMISTHQITACVLSLKVIALEVEKDSKPHILESTRLLWVCTRIYSITTCNGGIEIRHLVNLTSQMVFCQYGINNNISFMTVQKMPRMKISGNSEFHVLSDH